MKKRTLSFKFVCLLLILTFSFGLTSCAEGQTDGSGASDDSASSGTDEVLVSDTDGTDSDKEKLSLPEADDENPVLPVNRLPEKDYYWTVYAPGWSFANRIQWNLISIAHLRVEHCLKEPFGSYHYSASVLDSWKGDLPEKIMLSQSDACRYNPMVSTGFPAYTYGNEVVLVLYSLPPENVEYENAYYSQDGITCGFYVVRSDSGEVYLVALYDRLGESVAYCVPRYDDPALLKELEENFLEFDPIWKELEYSFRYVFRYEDLKAFIQNPDTDFSSHPEYEEPQILTAPADFDFAVEYGYGLRTQWNSVNTYKGTLTKDLVSAGAKTVDFTLSEEIKNRIYTKLTECDLKSITEPMTPLTLAAEGEMKYNQTPCMRFEIRFTLNGTEYKITGNEMVSRYPKHEQGRNVVSFLDYVISYVYTTPEFQAMPEAEGGYR